MAGSRSLQSLVLCFLLLLLSHVQRSSAIAVTDPVEVRALNAMLGRWGQSATSNWNKSGEPCSGWAIDGTIVDNDDFNPAIKCDCSFSNNRTCHITQLKVYQLGVTGTVPEELQSLTYLTNLNLGRNYLTGPLPAFIGNLTGMQYLTFGVNALSGTIPKELGKLKNLIALEFGSNSFNGSLPHELANLTNLEKWYMDSCGVTGALPPTLSKLKNLQIFEASDNSFTGKMPDFIGSWTNLNKLAYKSISSQQRGGISWSSLSSASRRSTRGRITIAKFHHSRAAVSSSRGSGDLFAEVFDVCLRVVRSVCVRRKLESCINVSTCSITKEGSAQFFRK